MMIMICRGCGERLLILPDVEQMGKTVHEHFKLKHRTLTKKQRYEEENYMISTIIKIILAKYHVAEWDKT